MNTFSFGICLVGTFSGMYAMQPGKQLVAGVPSFMAATCQASAGAGALCLGTPRGCMTTAACVGAAASVYVIGRKLLSPKMIDAEVQTDGVTPQQITGWLDDIVVKAKEFKEKRSMVADLCEVRANLAKAKKTNSEQDIAVYAEAEKMLVQNRGRYNLLLLPSFTALRDCSLPVKSASTFVHKVVTLNEVLQDCHNDDDFCTKFGLAALMPSADGKALVYPATIDGYCDAFAAYVEAIKADVLSGLSHS